MCVTPFNEPYGSRMTHLPELGETTQGKGGSPAAIPLPLPGFLPQSPAFLLPHPPMEGDVKLHVSMMLHKTQREEIYFMKS